MKILISFFVIIFVSSCSPDCKKETIKKPEWVTRYVNYYVDTLVSYSANDAVKLTEWSSSNTKKDRHIHYVTIRNNNTTYSNLFAVQFSCSYSCDTPISWTNTTEYIEIYPNLEHTFVYEWFGARGTYDSDFEVGYQILQEPKRILLKRRIDNLHLIDTLVNNCECDVEVLKTKYKAIQDVFSKITNDKLIKTK